MDKIRNIVLAHYDAGSSKTKELAHKFFDYMDTDNSGEVDIDEFMEFMEEEGHHRMASDRFFDVLDRDGDGALDFEEVMTLYYILKSGRPFCKYCKHFVRGVYFACLECYYSPQGPYCLCLNCYSNDDWDHHHNRRPRFLDNYTLLEAHRINVMNQVE